MRIIYNDYICGIFQGGLGNQLFILFTTMAYAIKYNTPYYFLNSERKRKLYFDTPLYKNINMFQKRCRPNYRERGHEFREIEYKRKICIFGYFQSPKYFENYKNEILDKLEFKTLRQSILKKHNIDIDVSLHFRLGDYKNTDCHPVCDMDYYIKCIKKIKEKRQISKVTCFFEEEDRIQITKNVSVLKDNFNDIVFDMIDTSIVDYEQMFLMSSAKTNIIANSSFSWWGAYLNENDNDVYYPKNWFAGKLESLVTRDMYPDKWTCV